MPKELVYGWLARALHIPFEERKSDLSGATSEMMHRETSIKWAVTDALEHMWLCFNAILWKVRII